jgi:restriction system protein
MTIWSYRAIIEQQTLFGTPDNVWEVYYGTCGCLLHLGPENIDTPISEIKQYLGAKYDFRFAIHPRIMEETVASVFKNMGYTTLVTAFSGDSGIDVILTDASGNQIGVQVKRSKNAIKIEQIRSFLGALVLGKYTKGIFVTTSRYQAGCAQIVRDASNLGYFIDLFDADKFLEALKISQAKEIGKHQDFLNINILPKLQLKFIGENFLNSL